MGMIILHVLTCYTVNFTWDFTVPLLHSVSTIATGNTLHMYINARDQVQQNTMNCFYANGEFAVIWSQVNIGDISQ